MRKNKDTLIMSILKVDKTNLHLFFQIFYSLVPKIEICLKCFLDKNLPKQPLWHSLGEFAVKKKVAY